MSNRFQELFIDIVAIFIILSATYESIFTKLPASTWGVQLGIGVVLLVSPLSKTNELLINWFKNKFNANK